ncbi:uncharacterized protein ACOB8E_000161 isoform 11-T11 [Sarcophilus harrisii]
MKGGGPRRVIVVASSPDNRMWVPGGAGACPPLTGPRTLLQRGKGFLPFQRLLLNPAAGGRSGQGAGLGAEFKSCLRRRLAMAHFPGGDCPDPRHSPGTWRGGGRQVPGGHRGKLQGRKGREGRERERGGGVRGACAQLRGPRDHGFLRAGFPGADPLSSPERLPWKRPEGWGKRPCLLTLLPCGASFLGRSQSGRPAVSSEGRRARCGQSPAPPASPGEVSSVDSGMAPMLLPATLCQGRTTPGSTSLESVPSAPRSHSGPCQGLWGSCWLPTKPCCEGGRGRLSCRRAGLSLGHPRLALCASLLGRQQETPRSQRKTFVRDPCIWEGRRHAGAKGPLGPRSAGTSGQSLAVREVWSPRSVSAIQCNCPALRPRPRGTLCYLCPEPGAIFGEGC